MRVVIVGGGIIGCATAWELARAGCEVAVVERGAPGGEASSAAAGLLAPLGEGSHTFRDLALASWRLYPGIIAELRERTGVDVEYVTRGTIYPLPRPPEPADAEGWALDPEFGVELLTGAQAREREPALSPRVRGAIFVKGDQWVNNQRLVLAWAQAAAGLGVELLTGRRVSRVLVQGSRALGVEADGERIEADAVVLSNGAWLPEITSGCGWTPPVEPRRGQMLALAHVPPVLRHCIHGEVYLVPRPSGEVLVGATVERAGFQKAVTAEGISGLLRGAIELVPSLGELPIARTWAGFRPWSPDALPILGPWPGISGLWLATAHFRNGILLAPITARSISEWIVQGRPSMDLEQFLPDRYLKA